MKEYETQSDLVEVIGYVDNSDMEMVVNENEYNMNMMVQEGSRLPSTDADSDRHDIIYEYDSSSGFESGEDVGLTTAPCPSTNGSQKSNMFKFTGTILDSESNYSIVTSSSMNLSSVVTDEERFNDNPDQHSNMENCISEAAHLSNSDQEAPTSHHPAQEIYYQHNFHQSPPVEEEEEFWINAPLRFATINKVLPFTYAAIMHLLYFFAVIELMINRKIDPLFVGIYMGSGYVLKWLMASLTKFAPKTVTLIASFMSIAGFLLLLLFHTNTTYVIIAIVVLHGNEVFHALQLFVKTQCQKDLKEMAQHLKNQYFTTTLAPPIIYFMAGLLHYTSTDLKQLAKLGLLLSSVQISFLTLFIVLDHFRPTYNHDAITHDNTSPQKSSQHENTIEKYQDNPSSKTPNLLSIIKGCLFLSHIQKLILRRKLLLDDFGEIAQVLETYSVQKNFITADKDEESISGQENETDTHNHNKCRISWASYLCGAQSCVVLLSFEAAPLLFHEEYHIGWRDMGFFYASITFPVIILSTIMMMLFLWDAQSKSFPLDLYTSAFGISLFALLTAMPNIIPFTIGLAGLYSTSAIFSINISYFQAIYINSHNLMTNEFWITLHGRHILSLMCVMITPFLYSKLRMLPSLIAFWLAFFCLITTLLYCECCYHSPTTKNQIRRKRRNKETDNKNDRHRSNNEKKKTKRKKLKRLRPPVDSNFLTPSDIVVLNFLTNGFSHIL